MVDALDLKSSDHYGRAGSSPALGTKAENFKFSVFFILSKCITWQLLKYLVIQNDYEE